MIKKIPQDDIIKSTLMFWVDEAIESKYEALYKNEEPKYTSVYSICTREGLKSFIKKNDESVKLLITVLGVSSEKFKRVITLLRIRKGYIVSSEWSENKVRTELCKSDVFMDEFCDLFFDQDKFKEIIPRSILSDFQLDSDRLSKLCSKDFLMKLIKTSYTTGYNSECSNAYQNQLSALIKGHCDKFGLSFVKVKNPEIDTSDDVFTITDGLKSIIVTMNYSVTTSVNQTNYSQKIQKIRSSIAGKRNYLLINTLDGAGWVARNSDFSKVYNDCNYFLNFNNIDKIDQILIEFFNIK